MATPTKETEKATPSKKKRSSTGGAADGGAEKKEKKENNIAVQLPSYMTGNLHGHISAFYEAGEGLLPAQEDSGYGYVCWTSAEEQGLAYPEVAHFRFDVAEVSQRCLDVLRQPGQFCQNVMVMFTAMGRNTMGQWTAKSVDFVKIRKGSTQSTPSAPGKRTVPAAESIVERTPKRKQAIEKPDETATIEKSSTDDNKAQKRFEKSLRTQSQKSQDETDTIIGQMESRLTQAVESEDSNALAKTLLLMMAVLPPPQKEADRPSFDVLRKWLHIGLKNVNREDAALKEQLIPGCRHVQQMVRAFEAAGGSIASAHAGQRYVKLNEACNAMVTEQTGGPKKKQRVHE